MLWGIIRIRILIRLYKHIDYSSFFFAGVSSIAALSRSSTNGIGRALLLADPLRPATPRSKRHNAVEAGFLRWVGAHVPHRRRRRRVLLSWGARGGDARTFARGLAASHHTGRFVHVVRRLQVVILPHVASVQHRHCARACV